MASIHDRISAAETQIKHLLQAGKQLFVSWSAGKDSSVTLSLTLNAARRLRSEGVIFAPIVVLHADTTVENPEVFQYSLAEIENIRAYLAKHDIPGHVEVVRPSLATRWAYRLIGVGNIPSYAGGKRDCTSDWKVAPIETTKRRLRAASGLDTVTVVGTRFSESTERAANMTLRGESDSVWLNARGEKCLSPIAEWSTRDVWQYLNLALNRQMEAYSDFEDTFRVYEDAAGTTCAIEADTALGTLAKGRGCGARHGCHVCQQVANDHSLEQMIEGDPGRYGYLAGLVRLRQYIAALRFDYGRRSWLGRTISNGYIRIHPDQIAPATQIDLLRYCLTLDVEEARAARMAGLDTPRFQLIDLETLIAIDAEWSRLGVQRPFTAIRQYADIYEGGRRYPLPTLAPVAKAELPAERFVWVGDDWDQGGRYANTGLADPILLAFTENCDLGEARTLVGRDGKPDLTIPNYHTEGAFTVDTEGAELVLCLEMDRLLEMHADEGLHPTAGYRYYLQMGTISLAAKQVRKSDEILRRTNYRYRQGLTGTVSTARLAELLEQSISRKEYEARTQDGSLQARDAQRAARKAAKQEALRVVRHGTNSISVPQMPTADAEGQFLMFAEAS
jgi:3'-phosphoadenosine 5'-phosphosulfate sulfotransferase (PAPS reductase)/FAD synthetase